MAHGLPVLTSNVAALPEVAGDAAWLVDPADTPSIAQGLNHLIEDEALRQRLARQGLVRSAGFTWEKAVEETWKVYQELLG
jgi:glycosyltransferase involved in cell wall biosynthesis